MVNASQSAGTATRSVSVVYVADGFVESVSDALGRVTSYAYDQTGRVTRQVMPDLREVSFTYDPSGNLTSVTPPSRPSHGFIYDAANQVTTYDPPALPEVPVPTTVYTYNADRQVELITRPNGQVINLVYATNGKLSAGPTGNPFKLDLLKYPRGWWGGT